MENMEETRKRMCDAQKKRFEEYGSWFTGKKWSDERKARFAEIIRKDKIENPEKWELAKKARIEKFKKRYWNGEFEITGFKGHKVTEENKKKISERQLESWKEVKSDPEKYWIPPNINFTVSATTKSVACLIMNASLSVYVS